MDEETSLTEEDKMDVIEFFDAYRLTKLPPGTTLEELPVSKGSLEQLLSDMGFLVSEAELIELEKKLDPDAKGYITLPPFLDEVKGLFARTRLTEHNVEAVFQIFDDDNDGLFREEDINVVLSLFGEKLPGYYLKTMIKEADMDGDNAIGMDEFKFFVAGEIF